MAAKPAAALEPGANVLDFQSALERVPPQSLDAEQALLGGVLVDGQALNQVLELLKPHDFYRPAHQEIFSAVCGLVDKSEPVDIITVSEWLKDKNLLDDVGGRSYLMDLAQAHLTSANTAYYARIIRSKSLLRALIHGGSSIVETAFEETDAETAIDQAQQTIFAIAQQGMPDKLTHVKDILPTTIEQIEERFENKGALMGMATGFYELDTMTSGLQKSDLIIVAARPSMGKTAFCLNIASHVSLREQKPVLVFSLEMSKEQLVTRMLCSEAELDAQKIRTGHFTESDFAKLSNAMGKLGDAPLYIDDSPGMTVMELRAKARKLKMETGDIGLIVIDYLQLMEGSGNGSSNIDNRVQVISAISRGLKGIARELQTPVIALSQLSRAVESRQEKKPMLSDLRESGSIEQDADLVMFIYRDEYYNRETERPGTADIIIAKQRNGPVGEVSLLFRHSWTKFLNPADKKIEIF
ncbi:MAG: replicative DNA helicase [Vampirovibrionales bacterium]|nr:replicative DNA helicase [Vampirovibrionales bacterium]